MNRYRRLKIFILSMKTKKYNLKISCNAFINDKLLRLIKLYGALSEITSRYKKVG